LLLLLVALGIGVAWSIVATVWFRVGSRPTSLGGIFRGFMAFLRIGLVVAFCEQVVLMAGYAGCLLAPPRARNPALALMTLVVVVGASLGGIVFWPALFVMVNGGPLSADNMEELFGQAKEGNVRGLMSWLADLNAVVLRLWLFGILIGLFAKAKLIVIPLYLRSLATHLKAPGVANDCVNLIKINLALMALELVVLVLFRMLMPSVRAGPPSLEGMALRLKILNFVLSPLSLLSMVLGWAQILWSIVVYFRLREVIDESVPGV
jgi:hypothetical protein